jgi:hypothetical protein
MGNPILIFVDPAKFTPPPQGRQGVREDGTIENIAPANGQYSLILLLDTDNFNGLSFQQDLGEPVLGIEHGGRPISRTPRLENLKNICAGYETAHTFSHVDRNDMFEFIRRLLRAGDNEGRQEWAAKIVDFVKSQDRWSGMVQWLMNEQIALLGGEKLNRDQLPHSADEFVRKHRINRYPVTRIIDDFLAG